MRYDLSDFEWSVIQPLLPNKPRGVKRVDDRRVLTAFSGFSSRVRRGATCRSAMVRARPATIASIVGARRACGTGLWTRSQRLTTAMCR